MAKWTVASLSQQARNGTTSHTFTFTQPAAGSFLVAVVAGPVTFTTPTGFTQVQSAVNAGGQYLFTKASATGSETSITCTTNSANFPAVARIYEFPSGSTILGSLSKVNAGQASFSGAALTALGSSVKLLVGVGSQAATSGTTPTWSAWSNSAVEDTDVNAPFSGNDGYSLGIAYLEDSVLTGWTPTATITSGSLQGAEAITFAVSVAAGGAPATPPILTMQTRRSY